MSCPIYYGLYKNSAITLYYHLPLPIKSTVFGNRHQKKGVLFPRKQYQQKIAIIFLFAAGIFPESNLEN